jgi:tetratricopeptide (TPR) repeat protein
VVTNGRRPAGSVDETRDFFISYTAADRAWAEWIAWQLQAAGYQPMVQAWDFRPGSNFVAEMNRALGQSGRTIAVLSPAYLKSPYGRDEWTAAFVHDQTGRPRLLVVRVEDVEPPALLRPWVHVDLVGLDAEQAREILLAGVAQEAVRPTVEPGFPGGASRAAEEGPRFPGVLPAVWNLPWPRNPAFTGRMGLLERLRSALTEVSYGPAVVALTGMGGVGKSQLAAEYAYRWQTDYDRVWWVRAEQPATLLADYAALADQLGLPERRDPDQGVVVAAVRGWLERNRRWLLVLDNAEQAATVRPVLPRGGGGGVVITSRNPVWRRDATPLPVEVLDREEAVAFLLERTGQTDATAAGELAEALGDLPLALEQAGAYIDEQGITLVGYTRQLRTRAPELFAAGQPPDYDHTVATTWTVSFQAVEQTSLAAADLLRLCAFLGPDTIPTALLEQGPNLLPEPLASAVADPDELAMAVAPARRYALVKLTEATLSLHRLVQTVTRHALATDERRPWATAAVRLVAAGFPSEAHNPDTWPTAARLLPHALTVTSHPAAHTTDPQATISLLNRVGDYLWGRAEYRQAKSLLEHALSTAEVRLGPEHPETATSLNNLALVLWAQGDLQAARTLHERALTIRETRLGPDHPDTATSHSNLAVILRLQGDLGHARTELERALVIYEACLGPDHPDTALSLSRLATVLRDQGDLDRARTLHERALQIREACLGSHHPETAWTLNNLAVVLHAQGDLDRARTLHERALSIRETRLGPHHPDTAVSLSRLATVLHDQGDLDRARTLVERALHIREDRLGPDHPDTARSRQALAQVVAELDNLS